jgi:hypothetical protein
MGKIKMTVRESIMGADRYTLRLIFVGGVNETYELKDAITNALKVRK